MEVGDVDAWCCDGIHALFVHDGIITCDAQHAHLPCTDLVARVKKDTELIVKSSKNNPHSVRATIPLPRKLHGRLVEVNNVRGRIQLSDAASRGATGHSYKMHAKIQLLRDEARASIVVRVLGAPWAWLEIDMDMDDVDSDEESDSEDEGSDSEEESDDGEGSDGDESGSRSGVASSQASSSSEEVVSVKRRRRK